VKMLSQSSENWSYEETVCRIGGLADYLWGTSARIPMRQFPGWTVAEVEGDLAMREGLVPCVKCDTWTDSGEIDWEGYCLDCYGEDGPWDE